jgi:hypothetical protein
MIPREILKKIRQIELRTNRLVTESAERGCPSRSTSALSGAFEISCAHSTVQPAAGGTPALLSLTPGFSPVTGDGESFNRFNGFSRARKPLKRLKFAGCVHTGLKPGFNERVYAEHARRSANRFSISAKTSSIGWPRPGCFSASSARRSSSSICSGVSSGSYPFSTMLLQTCCASSRRSVRLNLASISAFKVFQGNFPFGIGGAFQSWKPSINSSQSRCASSTRSSNGSFFAAAKIFFTDMDLFYSDSCREQFEIRHSSLVIFP